MDALLPLRTTGFMIEKSLSMDKVFVIALIFTFFAIPRQYQHRGLFRGILGVIALGATLVGQFSWVLYLFGVFLIFTGSKIFLVGIIGKIPAVVSLSVTFGLIAGGVLVSMWKTRGQPGTREAA